MCHELVPRCRLRLPQGVGTPVEGSRLAAADRDCVRMLLLCLDVGRSRWWSGWQWQRPGKAGGWAQAPLWTLTGLADLRQGTRTDILG